MELRIDFHFAALLYLFKITCIRYPNASHTVFDAWIRCGK
jgi:hypothetical protein